MKEPIPFGRYVLRERIDVGGMAEVFLARGPGGETCAVKRLLPGLGEDGELLSMFLDEARLAAQFEHPGLVEVRDLGRVGDSYYIAMEYVAGVDLGALLARLRGTGQRAPVALSAFVARQVALALDHVHGRRDRAGRLLGVVHRDVSPRNVLLSFAGDVKLIDFGIARSAARDRPGEERVLRGKVSYMSPEQAEGRPADRRSDVFALGAVLHEMLCGTRLFQGDSELAVLERIRSAAASPPSLGNPDVPPALDRTVLRALARDPGERFDSAGEFGEALAPDAEPVGAAAAAAFLALAMPEERERERRRALER